MLVFLLTFLFIDKGLTTTTVENEIYLSNQRTNCLNGWYQFGNKCFKGFALDHMEFHSWEDANKQCTAKGASLVSIHSQEELDFLITFILLDAAYNFWIGLHDQTREGDFQWSDNSSVNFTAWKTGEPSNSSEENCVEMIFQRGSGDAMGEWNDLNCNRGNSYICQMYTNPSHDSRNPAFCSEDSGGGFRLNESCYHIVDEEKTWTEAEEFCSSTYAGHLVTIHDFTITMFLKNMLFHSDLINSAIWIGASALNPGHWSSGWYLNKEVYHEDLTVGLCGVHLPTGHYDVRSCDIPLPSVCEYSPVKAPRLECSIKNATCPKEPAGWIDFGGNFCYFIEDEKPASWYEANFQCNRKGGYLASVHSEEELRSLTPLIRFKEQIFYYIGLYRKYDNAFAWADRSDVDFKHWYDGEPSSNTERCVEFWARTMRWNDINCDTTRAYICSVLKVSNLSDLSGDLEIADNGALCTGLSVKEVLGVVMCALLVIILLGVFLYFCRPWDSEPSRLRKISQDLLRKPKRRKVAEIVIKDNSDCYEEVT